MLLWKYKHTNSVEESYFAFFYTQYDAPMEHSIRCSLGIYDYTYSIVEFCFVLFYTQYDAPMEHSIRCSLGTHDYTYSIVEFYFVLFYTQYDAPMEHIKSGPEQDLSFFFFEDEIGRISVKKEGKAMIRNRYNYPTSSIRDIKGKETQTRNRTRP